ncbi:hypothetical protein FRC12_019140 [Ceratobasidium sp. 428]|nr:hypothetical protein FRC12_019140 [Ceratobasidium sp. 428]
MGDNPRVNQRSRHGCLTCRRKRKKCDEERPECLRCMKSNSQCMWPTTSSYLSLSGESPRLVTGPTMRDTAPTSLSLLNTPNRHVETADSCVTTMITSSQNILPDRARQTNCWQGLPVSSGNMGPSSLNFLSVSSGGRFDSLLGSNGSNLPSNTETFSHQLRSLGHVQGPSCGNGTRTSMSSSNMTSEEDTDDEWDPDGALLVIRRSITVLGNIYDPDFHELLRSIVYRSLLL